jgi:4-hydroxy-tetrahydrodipicolinate synthase
MFTGSLVAIVTPMAADGSVDFAAWDRLLDFHVAAGTDGIVVAGTTGESPTLSLEEIAELTRRAVARCRGKTRTIVGCGTNSTASTVARTQALSRLGVDAVMLVAPYYNKPPQEGLYRHFTAAADVSAVPVILYNVPGRTSVDLGVATVARLASHPRIVALKEATGTPQRIRELVEICPADFALLSGDDATFVDFVAMGGKGVISVTANVAPQRMREVCAAVLAGDIATARTLDASLQPLHRDLFVEANPIPVKWAVARMGLIGGAMRLPLVEMCVVHQETILRAMRTAGIELKGQAA